MSGARVALFRADASLAIGTGHVARCATLAGELRSRGWRTILAARDLPDEIGRRLTASGLEIIALPSDGELEHEPDHLLRVLHHVALVVTDHYGIGASWQRRAHDWADVVMAIDDLAEQPQDVQLLLDQNLGADAVAHRRLLPRDATLLVGPRYALVRPAFAEARDRLRPHTGRVERILVFMSGADPGDMTAMAVAAVADAVATDDVAIDVVVGGAYPFAARLAGWVAEQPNVRLHVDTDDMARLMEAAHLAIGAPGSASWERCTLGLPAVLLTLAPNQEVGARGLAAAGAAIALGAPEAGSAAQLEDVVRALMADPERVRAMSVAAAAVTDGRGTERVADALGAIVGTGALAPAAERRL